MNRLKKKSKEKYLYVKHVAFELYLSVCSGEKYWAWKSSFSAARDFSLIIRKVDLPLCEVGMGLSTALQIPSFPIFVAHTAATKGFAAAMTEVLMCGQSRILSKTWLVQMHSRWYLVLLM